MHFNSLVIFSLWSSVMYYQLPLPCLSHFFFTLKWPGGTQIISCPKEPDLDIWAENLGHTTHQPNLVLKLSHFRRHIPSYVRDFLSTQIFKKMIFELTIRGPKVVSQARGLHCIKEWLYICHMAYIYYLYGMPIFDVLWRILGAFALKI